jgi:hypothetical protein
MVYDSIPSLGAGRPLLSTVRIIDWSAPCGHCEVRPCRCGENAYPPHPGYIPFTDYRQLLDFRDGDVLMDEVTGVASSRESASLPAQVANYLVQLRRRDVLLRWTSPNWARADKIMREVTQGVTYCSGYFPKVRRDGVTDRMWRDRRLFFWRTYDAMAFDEFTAHKRESVKATARQLFWRPSSCAEDAYDTLDQVHSLGATVEGGLCISCGGRRSTPACSCPDQPARGRRRRAGVARNPARGEDAPDAPTPDPDVAPVTTVEDVA